MQGESLRQRKVGRQIERDLGEILREVGVDSVGRTGGCMVSVTRVRMTPDLEIARVYLSVFPSEGADEVVERVNARVGEVRNRLGRRVRSQLRVVPSLEFYLDDSLDYIEHIDRLLKNDTEAMEKEKANIEKRHNG